MKSPSRCFYELFILFIGITLLPFIGIPLLSESLLLASSYFPTSYWHPPIGIRLLALLAFCFLFRLQCAHVPTLCPNGPVTFSFDLPLIIHSIILPLSLLHSPGEFLPLFAYQRLLRRCTSSDFPVAFRNQFPSSSRGPLPFTHRWGIRFFSYSLVVSSTHLLLSCLSNQKLCLDCTEFQWNCFTEVIALKFFH